MGVLCEFQLTTRIRFGIRTSLAIVCLCAMACSRAVPELTTGDLPDLQLDSDSLSFKGRNLNVTSISLKGQISFLADTLQLSFDQGATWVTPTVLTPSSLAATRSPASTCSICPFVLTVANIGTLSPSLASASSGSDTEIWVRGTGKFGNTGKAVFKITRTSFQSYGVLSINDRGADQRSPVLGSYKVKGGAIVARGKPSIATGYSSRGGIQQ